MPAGALLPLSERGGIECPPVGHLGRPQATGGVLRARRDVLTLLAGIHITRHRPGTEWRPFIIGSQSNVYHYIG